MSSLDLFQRQECYECKIPLFCCRLYIYYIILYYGSTRCKTFYFFSLIPPTPYPTLKSIQPFPSVHRDPLFSGICLSYRPCFRNSVLVRIEQVPRRSPGHTTHCSSLSSSFTPVSPSPSQSVPFRNSCIQ